MMWEAKLENAYGWKKRFAFWPKRIGDYRIWLEKYEFRILTHEEHRLRRFKDFVGDRVSILKEFRTDKIRSAWRLDTLCVTPFSTRRVEWIEVDDAALSTTEGEKT